jgi:hypothetical protein
MFMTLAKTSSAMTCSPHSLGPQFSTCQIFLSAGGASRFTCSSLATPFTYSSLQSSSFASDPRISSTPLCLTLLTAVAKSSWVKATTPETNKNGSVALCLNRVPSC